jgi:hypothetical protein
MINAWLAICPALQPSRDQQPGGCSQAPSFPSNTSPDCLQLAGGDLAALSREVLGVPDPDISRAAGGGYGPKEGEESEGGGGACPKPTTGMEPAFESLAVEAPSKENKFTHRLPLMC